MAESSKRRERNVIITEYFKNECLPCNWLLESRRTTGKAKITLICTLIEKFEIEYTTIIFKLGEHVFSIRGTTLDHAKYVAKKVSKGKKRETNIRGRCENVNIMLVVSGAGRILTPPIVPPNKEAQFWKRGAGRFETWDEFFLQIIYLFFSAVTGIGNDIFFPWAQNVFWATAYLRKGDRKLLLIMESYICHFLFKTLSPFKDNEKAAARLQAHTSNIL